jgi:hypothetical protein
MRRALLAVAATVAGLVALLSFRSAGGDQQRPGASGPAADSGPAVSGPTVGAPAPSLPPLPPGARAVTGRVINTLYGPVQVQVVVKARKILGVNILQRPSATEMDVEIGQYALPQLVAETLAAQSARIDTVSGATYTSGGYINSLQNALDDGA